MSINNSNTEPKSFDVFLCHNSEDKPEIRRIADDLIKQGIKPWLDVNEIKPGELWQSALEEQIASIKSAAVFVGESAIGPWQSIEIKAFINEFVERKCPVIPAILPSAKTTPTFPILLKNLHYVDFREADPDPLVQLQWGITGEKPKSKKVLEDAPNEGAALLPEKEKQLIEIRLPGNLDSFSPIDKEKLLNALSTLLQIGEIKITASRPGSTRLFLELSPEDANKIYEAAKSGQLDRLGVTEARLYPSLADPPNDEQRSQLLILLNRVKEFWIDGVLKQSLHHEVLISLGKRAMDDAVEPPWQRTIELPKQRRQLSLSDTRIETVFDATGLLLILGEPGSGKTTTLLELVSILIERASADPKERIPVVLNLSSWKKPQTLIEWMVERLSSIYSVPKKLALTWLDKGYLIPLLDGLDEVATEHQAECVEAINNYINLTNPKGLVVCCRLKEYQWLPEPLQLNGAICLEPLNRQQIDQYFAVVGPEFESLRITIQEDTVLRELAQSPLMLNVMSLAYQSAPVESVAEGAEAMEARRTQIFAAYVDKMFQRKGNTDKVFPKEKTLFWLSWLAGRMNEQSQSVFFIENIQPSWLENRKQQLTYLSITSLMISWLILGMPFGIVFLFLLKYVLIGFVIFAFINAQLIIFFSNIFKLHSRAIISISASISGMISVLISGLISGLNTGLIISTDYGIGLGLLGLGVASLLAMFWWLGFGALSSIRTVERLSWSWKFYFKTILKWWFFIMVVSLVTGLYVAGLYGIIVIIFIGVLGGFTDQISEEKAMPNEGIKLSLENGIFAGFVATLIIVLIGAVIAGPFSLFVGLFGGLIVGLNRGLGAVIKHYVLRSVLCFSGKTPFNFIKFLDYCAKLILLKKVGGGYIFIHRMLLEYFAKLGTATSK